MFANKKLNQCHEIETRLKNRVLFANLSMVCLRIQAISMEEIACICEL